MQSNDVIEVITLLGGGISEVSSTFPTSPRATATPPGRRPHARRNRSRARPEMTLVVAKGHNGERLTIRLDVKIVTADHLPGMTLDAPATVFGLRPPASPPAFADRSGWRFP
ncbi:hypothetical protein [Rhizobium sp. LjRoot258]|uniref:hypothetical protein n=1 Tax=Rhizobium sp. LjRoot258 TaxID=3342299 RepID=UPI003ECF8D7D